jgi:hypothetical protein
MAGLLQDSSLKFTAALCNWEAKHTFGFSEIPKEKKMADASFGMKSSVVNLVTCCSIS